MKKRGNTKQRKDIFFKYFLMCFILIFLSLMMVEIVVATFHLPGGGFSLGDTDL